MADAKREISGFFLSTEKFSSHVAALASPDCTTSAVRLFHNEPHHTAAVVDALGRNASVTALDIFELDPASASALAGVLSASPRLASLAVRHPHAADAARNLCRGLAANRTLTRLQLAHLDPPGITALADALLAWSTPTPPLPTTDMDVPAPAPSLPVASAAAAARLQHLRLERCAFSPDAAAALSAALGGQGGALAELEVVECDLGDAVSEALLLGNAAAMPGASCCCWGAALERLDLSTCHVGPRGAAALGCLLAASSSLHSLCLANNKALGCEGAKALAAGLAANRALRRLDLSRCGVSTTGALALAAALAPPPDAATAAEEPPIQHLVFNGNSAGAAGFAALLRVLSGPKPCALRTLQLEHNHIRCGELLAALGLPAAASPAAPPPIPTAAALAQAVDLPRVTAPLEQLSLAGNALYDAGITALAACLATSPALEQLDLRKNGISDSSVAALLPLIAPRGGGAAGGGGRGSGGGAAVAEVALAGAPTTGLQGLLLDGNRLHNAGGQALLAAVTAAPGLWRFSAEANKLTDPALRLSLTQLSQMRAARHSQLVVLGRHYSSSSSSEDGGGGRHGSGGGGGTGGNGNEATSPMDLDGGGDAAPPAPRPQGRGGGGSRGGPSNPQHPPHHKHRLDDRDVADGDEVSSGDDQRRSLRNVAARSADGDGGGRGGGGGGPAVVPSGGLSMSDAWPCLPPEDAGRGSGAADGWCGARAIIGCDVDRGLGGRGVAASSGRDRSSGGGSSTDCGSCGCGDTPMRGTSSGGASAASSGAAANSSSLYGSPPPAMCFVRAMTTTLASAVGGVGGAASVGVSKRVSGVGESDHPTPARALPQQLLPACRRPRYKPLTPEQQRLFQDF